MKITGQMIVKNEDQWIWFAIQSVLPYLDKLIIFDTGSTDQTIQIIKSINSSKIIFEEKGLQTPEGLVKLRHDQLDKTTTDWFLIIDGDEIWPESQFKKLTLMAKIAPDDILATFNYSRNSIGDVFHYLSEEHGSYQLGGKKGTLNMRLIKKTADLRVEGVYPLEAYLNSKGPISAQNEKLLFVDCWYLHTSFLRRSSTDQQKVSGSFGKRKIWEKGKTLAKANLPEVLFKSRPSIVPDPFKSRGIFYEGVSLLTSPIINLKRKVR